MLKFTKEMLDTKISDMTPDMNDTNITCREFLENSWKQFTSSDVEPDFDKLGNGHLSVMMNLFIAKKHHFVAA